MNVKHFILSHKDISKLTTKLDILYEKFKF